MLVSTYQSAALQQGSKPACPPVLDGMLLGRLQTLGLHIMTSITMFTDVLLAM